jgi:hypothetical protein
MSDRAAIIIALGIIIASILNGGIYQISAAGGEGADGFVLNRYTGQVFSCRAIGGDCYKSQWPQQ